MERAWPVSLASMGHLNSSHQCWDFIRTCRMNECYPKDRARSPVDMQLVIWLFVSYEIMILCAYPLVVPCFSHCSLNLRVDKAQVGKLEENLRSCRNCRHIYPLREIAQGVFSGETCILVQSKRGSWLNGYNAMHIPSDTSDLSCYTTMQSHCSENTG